MLVALGHFVGRLQLFVVRVLDAERFADVVDDVLIGRRVVAAGRFLAGEERVLDVDVDVAAGDVASSRDGRAGVSAHIRRGRCVRPSRGGS